jgi:hypothetical protein
MLAVVRMNSLDAISLIFRSYLGLGKLDPLCRFLGMEEGKTAAKPPFFLPPSQFFNNFWWSSLPRPAYW